MQFLFRKVAKYPKVVVAMVVLLTIVFGFYAQRVGITTDIKSFFPEDHPQVISYDEISETFGGADRIMVAFTTTDVFTLQGLITIDQLTHELELIQGVTNVRSLTTIDDIAGSEWGIDVIPLVGEIPTEEQELAALRERVLEDDMYVGTIVSSDATGALHVVEVDPSSSAVEVALLIQELLESIDLPEGQLYLTGTPVLNAVLADSMQADLMKLFPIVLLLVAAILFLYFKNLRGVFLPFITVLISVVWTLGLMGMLGKQLSPLNAVMPVLLVSLGSAYGIYIIARYNDELLEGAEREQAVHQTLKSVGISVLLAGTTTIAGFASNVSSSITLMKDFGLFTAFGVLVALLISLTFIPAMLLLLPVPKKVEVKKGDGQDRMLARILGRIAHVVVAKKRVVLVAMAIILVLAVLGIPQLSTDSNFFNFFADDTAPKIAYEMVKDKFSGSESVEIVITGDLLDPDVLHAMANLQTDLEQTGLVGRPQSIVNILQRVNMALNDGDPDFEVLPTTRELAAQYLLLMEMSGGDMVEQFITLDYGQARIQALVRDSSNQATTRLFSEIDMLFAKYFAHLDVEASQTGIVALLDALASMIIQGQISSLFMALLTVFVIVLLLLRSWEGSLFSTMVVASTILINFGVMGWLGIPLDIVTVLISSIGVGVGVDYSIHIYTRYQEEREKHDPAQSVTNTIIHTGKAIVTNAGSVIAGFLILLLSSFPPFRYFGSLVTMAMFVASSSALIVLPALILLRWESRTKAGKEVVAQS